MFFSAAVQVVFKTTGGRIWNKRWGLPRLTQTRKENRKKDIQLYNKNMSILKAAEHLQPEVPVRLAKPLPQWQVDLMRARLEKAQRLLNLRGGPLSAAEAEQLMRRRPPAKQMPQPPQDPQLKQQHLQHRLQQQQQQQQQQQKSHHNPDGREAC